MIITTKITLGLLAGMTFLTGLPIQTDASVVNENEIYVTTNSFSAGAHSAINETVVLNDIYNNSNLALANVSKNEIPIVANPELEIETFTVVKEEEKVEFKNGYENIAIAKVNEYLNVRAEANSESEVLGKLYNDGAATILETLDGWYKVESGNVTGYVNADYVVVGNEEVCKEASKRIGTVNTETLRLRKEASTEAGIHTLLSTGAKVTVIDESIDDWYKIEYKSYTGYVSSEYLNIETVYTYAESREEEEARLAKEAEERAREEAERTRREESKNKQESNRNDENKNYNPPTGGNGQAVVDYAVQFVGNPYVWGGESLTNGADCSGFVMKVYEAFGVSLPHSSASLRSVGYGVSASEVRPGDIICYSGHVAIYMGNGKIVHASNKKDGIKISNNWQYRRVLAIRRIF